MGQKNSSNQRPSTENPGVHPSGAVSFGDNTTFEGVGNAFGAHNTVNIYGPDASELKKHQLIATLPRAEAGRKVHEYKKQSGPCFPGTRQAVLQKMKDWATNSNEFGMYVLSGLAGIGKSTVAYTISAWADDPKRHLLGAEFFFSRDEADRKSANLFFTTIAYDLYHFNKEFERAIGGALVTKGRSTGTPQEQLNALILDPLKSLANRKALPPTLIVVDALDECDDKDACFILEGLQKLVQTLPSFKVILTTRPDAFFDNDSTTQEGRKIFRLHDIEDDVVNEDIRIYLEYYLSAEQVKARLPRLRKQWCASDVEVERLIQASGKLFIMASTVVRYILDTSWSAPHKQIKRLLDGHTPFKNLVDFYTIILRSAIPDKCHDTGLIERYQAIVGIIVLAQVPLSVNSIASLMPESMDIDVDEISVVLLQLQSVISVTDDIPRVYHKSFVDYITDSEQCKDINLRIDRMKHHTWITRRCFKTMGKHLKFNILGLGIPARFMSNEEGLAKDRISDEKLQEKIPLVLRYACAYWDGHLNSASTDDADLVKEMEKFDNARVLLPWFEVLSLIRKLDSAPRAIRAALKVLEPTPSDLRRLLSDGLRFISKFYEIIEGSALHTYYSALPFTPTESLLYRRYIDKALYHGCNVIGTPNQWDAFIANMRQGHNVHNIQFSPDSAMLVSWNFYAGLRACDAVTGTSISTFKGGRHFAIASDFSTVASFKDNAITLYNVDGSKQGTTLTTSGEVLRVAVSSSRIAAGLPDGTVSLWDTRDGQDCKPISFKDYRYCDKHGDLDKSSRLKFSATGVRLAYLSAKKDSVKLWDMIKGELVADLDWGLHGFAFSRDGSRVVSWQERSGMKLWDCEDGQPVGTILNKDVGHVSWDAVAISDNGSLLAIACRHNMEVWASNRVNLSQVVDLDLRSRMLVFSRDDTLAIATDDDVKLYSIKNRSFLSTFSHLCYSLAFSPDCTRLAVGGSSDRVILLDTQAIESSSPSSNQQKSTRLIALGLSWNCSRVACGFEDGAVELWETDGFPKRRIAAHNHHQQGIMTLVFSPDGRQFASGSHDGTIVLYDGEDGARRADLKYSPARDDGELMGVEVSNSVLAAAGNHGISLWDCKTLDRIQSFDGYFEAPLSFSADDALLAAFTVTVTVSDNGCSITYTWSITVFDVTNHIAIANFEVTQPVRHMSFLPDNSQLVVWPGFDGSHKHPFIIFNLVSKKAIPGPSFETFIQLPDMPLWHGAPVWMNQKGHLQSQYYLEALFSQHDGPVPVLWIPLELGVSEWVQGRSMIVIRCEDGRVVLLRLPTTATGTAARVGYDGNLSYGRPAQQPAAAGLPHDQNTHVPTIIGTNEAHEDEDL